MRARRPHAARAPTGLGPAAVARPGVDVLGRLRRLGPRGRGGRRRPPIAAGPEAAVAAGPHHVLAALAAALRGPQLDGALDRVPTALPRPGAGRARAGAAGRRHRPRRLEPLDPSRGAARRAARDRAHAAQEDRLHHAGDPLDAGTARRHPGDLALPGVLLPAVLGRAADRRGLPGLLRRGDRGVAVLLARAQRRGVAPGLPRPGTPRRARRQARVVAAARRGRRHRRPARRLAHPGRDPARRRHRQRGPPSVRLRTRGPRRLGRACPSARR